MFKTQFNIQAIKIIDKKNRKRQMGYSLLRGNNNNNMCLLASKENEMKIKREISILKKCRHPNVVQLIEVMDHPESRKLYMALEYNEYGEIEWRDENDRPILTIDEARKIFRDIVNGLDYCMCFNLATIFATLLTIYHSTLPRYHSS